MKRNFDNRKGVEEIFSDDILSERLRDGDSFEQELSESDLRFSRNLFQAITSDTKTFNSADKDFLGARIIERIEKSKRRKIYARIGYAASVLLIIGASFYFVINRPPDIAGYAARSGGGVTQKLTQIILPKGKIIQVETPESKIAYSKSGSSLTIDSGDEISQPLESDEAYNTIVVPYGKRSQVTLADNSTIWLNSGSKLVYPVRFAKDKREVYLEGEALFDVAHNESHPFYVVTKGLEIKVLGTVFDLSAYDEDSAINTILERGLVEVIYKKSLFGSSHTRLVPGKMASYNLSNKEVVLQDVNTKDFTSWKDGYLALEKKSLESIARRLSRYYNVSIEFENPELAKETFSGYLDLRNSAIQVLGMISEMMDIEIIQSDKVIKIRRKGARI